MGDPNLLGPNSYAYGQPDAFQTQQTNSNATTLGHNRPSWSQSSNRFVPRVMLMLVILFLILSLVISIAWLVIDPDDPTFHLNSLSVSNINMSDSRFAAAYDMEFLVKNTNNKAYLVIDCLKVGVSYRKDIISENVLEQSSLSVPKTSQKKLKLPLDCKSAHRIKNKVFKNISDDWSKKVVNLNVQMYVRVKYELGVWPSKSRFFDVSCMDFTVHFLSNKGPGRLMDAGRNCSVQSH